jgi:single stranded DNA-binding protein (ssb)
MSLNKVILIGFVGKDPDVRYYDNGNAMATFTMATTDRGYKLANGTEVPERTEWHNILATRERAQFVEKFVKKGSLVCVEGKIRSRSYDDKDGIKRYFTEIYTERIEFFSLGTRREGSTNTETTTSVDPVIPAIPADIPVAPEQADDLPF